MIQGDASAMESAGLCIRFADKFQDVAKCVRRLGWSHTPQKLKQSVFLACATYLAPTIAITTRRDLGKIGDLVSTVKEHLLCKCTACGLIDCLVLKLFFINRVSCSKGGGKGLYEV